MFSYELKINETTIYKVEVNRIDDLTMKSKANEYSFKLWDIDNKLVFAGFVKHKYNDGAFLLMNKVNRKVHDFFKKDPDTKEMLDKNFELIKHGQRIRRILKE